MTRYVVAVLMALALLVPMRANATAQIPDRIRIDGVEHALNTNPLEPVLRDSKWRPPADAAISSANWRGYLADWEVADGQLVLRDVTIRVFDGSSGRSRSILGELFPEAAAPVPADWYSGALIIPEGKVTKYVHMGYGSTYERYQVLRIKAGRVVEHLRMTQDGFERYREQKFDAFKRTDAYRAAFAKIGKDYPQMPEALRQDFLKSFYAEEYLSAD